MRRIKLLRRLLPQFGVEPERLHLGWVSASEGEKFTEEVTEFTERVRELGPTKTYELSK